MSNIYDQINDAELSLLAEDNQYRATLEPLKAELPKFFAATKIILDQAHDIVSHYACSLGNHDYYGIARDDWQIGEDWNFTSGDGICFSARVNVGYYREPEYRSYYVTLPWHILESYINEPINTQLELTAKYQENILKVKQEEERKNAEKKAAQERAREELDRKQYEALKAKFEGG
jgi:hypothetical protein